MPKADTPNTMPTADQHSDAVIELLDEHRSLLSRLNSNEELSDEDEIHVVGRCTEIDEQLATLQVTTLNSALAALQRLKEELQTYVFDTTMPPVQRHLYEGLIKGVAEYLRGQGPTSTALSLPE